VIGRLNQTQQAEPGWVSECLQDIRQPLGLVAVEWLTG